MRTEIFKNYIDFLQIEDKNINGVSEEFAQEHPNYQEDNVSNIGCWNCSGCSDCSKCSGCSGCSGLTNKSGNENFDSIKIPNIHSAILEAVKGGEQLNMDDWHTCETTHCRAGWAVHLAGKEGYDLENKTSTEFAAMCIFSASSPIKVPPTKFFLSNEESMKDIIRCADEEKELLAKLKA